MTVFRSARTVAPTLLPSNKTRKGITIMLLLILKSFVKKFVSLLTLAWVRIGPMGRVGGSGLFLAVRALWRPVRVITRPPRPIRQTPSSKNRLNIVSRTRLGNVAVSCTFSFVAIIVGSFSSSKRPIWRNFTC